VEQSSPLYAGPKTAGVAALKFNSSLARVRDLRSSVDWLIVQLHWGMEMSQLPSPQQRELARKFVDAGADLILGHHPHVLQPFEVIDGVPVAYSLGNFLFSEMYSRGVNIKGQQFCAKLRLHPLSRLTGWLDVVLTRGQPPQVHLAPCLLRRDLVVVPDAGRNMIELLAMLNRDNYAEAYKRECDRAQARTTWRWDCKPLMRRVEMKLFSLGLLPGAFEGT
jgi:poly-gamma-glutamate synthesis protein (capsule biosynthesis protein)